MANFDFSRSFFDQKGSFFELPLMGTCYLIFAIESEYAKKIMFFDIFFRPNIPYSLQSRKFSILKVAYFFWKNSKLHFCIITCARINLTIKWKIIRIMSHCVIIMSHRLGRFSKNKKLRFFNKACSFFIFFSIFLLVIL